MKSKAQQIRDALEAGDRLGALRIASRFHDRSHDTMIFKRGFDAHNNPSFYRQIGKDPEQLTAIAVALLEMKFAPARTDAAAGSGTAAQGPGTPTPPCRARW